MAFTRVGKTIGMRKCTPRDFRASPIRMTPVCLFGNID
jgi:hypothetical protein